MKSTVALVVLLALLSSSGGSFAAGQARELQQAIDRMETRGDYLGAVRLFEKIARGPDRSAAARALLYAGLCYEKLGRSEARRSYERIVREFGDQPSQAAEARERLAVMQRRPASSDAPTLRRVWEGPEVDFMGAPSPDGRFLCYVDRRRMELAIRDIATGEDRILRSPRGALRAGHPASPIFSPDGSRIACVWRTGTSTSALMIVPLDGSEARILSPCDGAGPMELVDWSRDGRTLVVVQSRQNNRYRISSVMVSDGSCTVVKETSAYPGKAALSPDAAFVAFDQWGGGERPARDIFLVETASGREAPLVEHPADEYVLGWAPDGKRLLFARNRSGGWAAWSVRVEQGRAAASPELLVPELGKAVRPMGVTSRGSLYYGMETATHEVFVARLESGLGEPVRAAGELLGWTSSPDFSLDGSRVAFILETKPKRLILRSLSEGSVRELVPDVQAFFGARWAPDGRSLLVIGADAAWRQGVYRVDAESGKTEPLVQVGAGPWIGSAEWGSGDGEIFFERSSKLYLADRQSPDGRDLGLGSVGKFALSPDRTLAAVTTLDRGSGSTLLEIVSLRNRERTRLVEVSRPHYITALDWSAGGRQIVFGKADTSPSASSTEICRVAVEGGPVETVGVARGRAIELRVRPDGREIAVTTLRLTHEIWVAENLLPPQTGKAPARSAR